jgi:large subunit ribosomal protein L24e
MVRTEECDFCGAEIEPGTGTVFVRKDGTTVDYCSSKCEKNADLGREPRDLAWTEEGRPDRTEAPEDEAEPEEAAGTAEAPGDETDAERDDEPDAETAADDESESDAEGEDDGEDHDVEADPEEEAEA